MGLELVTWIALGVGAAFVLSILLGDVLDVFDLDFLGEGVSATPVL